MRIVSTLTRDEIAGQICELINKYNGWARRFTPARLKATDTTYVVELVGNKVAGVGGMRKLSNAQTEFMHLCVRPEFRRLGIANLLSKKRLCLLETPIALSYIRSDNIPSINNSIKSGFVPIKADYKKGGYNILTSKRGYSLLTFIRFKNEGSNTTLRNVFKEILHGTLFIGSYSTV